MTGARVRERAYLVLALVGGLGTAYFNLQWITGSFEHDVAGFLRPAFANSAASSFGVDLLVSFAAASLFILSEGRRLEMRRPWVYVAGSFLTAIAFTFPLFLAMRERSLAARAIRS